VPAAISFTRWPRAIEPSTTRTSAATPTYGSNQASKMSARSGAAGFPRGGGTSRTTRSSSSWMPVPSFAETGSTEAASKPSTSSISSAARTGSAAGRSILFATGTMARSAPTARYAFASVCASMPCDASTTRIAPSQACSARDTS
jgi:hypothetical protein